MRTVIPSGAKTIPHEATCVFEGVLFDVYQWQQRLFDGRQKTFEMLKRPDTVEVLAVKDNKIVVFDEEQPGHVRADGLPGGRNDIESETELDCAKRELLEESGMSFKSWRLLDAYRPFTKIDWFVYIFLAHDFDAQIAPQPDGGEKITIRMLSFEQCVERSQTKEGKYLPKALFEQAGSIEGLLGLPEYH